MQFHPGQWRAWQSKRRIVCILAGTQGGKTSFGPHWLRREIQNCGPGDYMIVTPTFQLLEKKALPEFLKLFQRWERLGRYFSSPSRKFLFSPDGERKLWGKTHPDTPTQIFFGYAEDPESLESATAKGAWLDECGQKKFKLGSLEAVFRRLSLSQGRILMTTTPYDLGYLKQQVWDRWKAGDPDYDVIRFDSTENPTFPKEEFERARRTLPKWKFDLFYRAIFTRPAGMIYDCFEDHDGMDGNLCKPFVIPDEWPRALSLDFGGVNTAAILAAQELKKTEEGAWGAPTGRWFAYREYHAGGRTAKQHAEALRRGEPIITRAVGGARSEGQWRNEFHQAGLPVQECPIIDVEVGINRVYGWIANRELIFFDTLTGLRDEMMSYSRELDDSGEPTEKIENKETFHRLDALRYLAGLIRTSYIAPPAYRTRGRGML